jgi:uncharacterized protein YjdB
MVRGRAAGTALITATANGRSASATIRVANAPVGAVTLAAPSSQVAVGGVLHVTATVRDTTGAVVNDRGVTWAASPATIATVSAAGDVAGVSAGTAVITATVEGRSATITVQVTPILATQIALSPTGATLVVGATQQFTATVRSTAGAVITGRPVTWATNNASVATVSTTGLVTARAIGAATLTATADLATTTATVLVTAPPATYTLTATGGNGQTGYVGQALPSPLSVMVADGAGRPVSGVGVTFAVTSGGGTIGGASTATNTLGVATSGVWTLGAVTGTNTAVATARLPNGTTLTNTFTPTATTSSPP